MKRKKLYRKMICSIIITSFLLLSINPTMAQVKKNENTESRCYGFIVTLETKENYTTMDQINCKIRHMINDLLRQEIPIYWTAENNTINVKDMEPRNINENKLFEKGSFIIPFTGNITDDNKIIAIIYDYNQSSEIETNNPIKIPIYIILESIKTQVFPLNNAKIALLYSRVTTGGFIFLKLASLCGFLNIQIVKDDAIYTRLNNDNFNVLFHPGGTYDTLHFLLHLVYEDIAYRKSDGVRSFVSKGGGYIGSCGGLTKASAGGKVGKIPIGLYQLYLKKQVYNPNLKSIGVSAIADILIRPPPKREYDNQIKIINLSSPITFGLDDIVWDYWCGGPEIYHTGENVEVVGVFHNTKTRVDGTPAWVTAEFGDGKIAIFSPHPEIAGMKKNPTYESQSNTGKTVISNSLFYTTADEQIEYETHLTFELSYIYDIWQKTANLTEDIFEIEKILDPIRNRINTTKELIDYLTVNLSELISLIEDIAIENKIDLSDIQYKYYLGLDYAMDVKKYYYELFKEFFNGSDLVFDKIELINELLKNDTEFKTQIKTLIINLHNRLNETDIILDKSQVIIDAYKQDLLGYQQKIFRSKIKENQLKIKGNTLYIHVYSGFSQVPQIYFDSLKFLRSNWYKFEAEYSINKTIL